MVNTACLVARRFNTVSLIKLTLALYIAAAPAYSYAIDPITGGFTANAIASAALGGTANGAALGAAVDAAVGAGAAVGTAAAAAAAIAGIGIASFCGASYLYGNNSCGGGKIGEGLASGGIRQDPATGDLIIDASTPYYRVNPFPDLKFTTASSACDAFVTAYTSNTKTYKSNGGSVPTPAASGAGYLYCSLTTTTTATNVQTTQDSYAGSYVVPPPTTRPATPEEIGAAVGASAGARAAAAAATGSPDLAAAEAAAAAATASPNTPAGDCAAKGMKSGTFQGATFCVGDASASGTGTGDLGGEVGDTGTGTGTGTGAENPPANPPATETPAFCGWAVTLCTWLEWTKTDPVAKTQAETKVDIKDRQTTDIPNLPVGINTTRISWSQQCPSPITANFNLMGQSVDWQYKFDTVCDFAAKFRPYVIGLSYLTAAYIVMGLNRTRSE